MVFHSYTLATLVVLAAVSLTVAAEVPSFDVPSFDYAQLYSSDIPSQVLSALKADGIISLANIPGYTQTRAAYLQTAAACAVSAEQASAEFLLRKTLADGTQRYTISTTAGQALDMLAIQKTDAQCPGYAPVYRDFTLMLERAVYTLAATLDASGFTARDGSAQVTSNRQLFGDAVRLDHFHAYEAPSLDLTGRNLAAHSADDLSLPLHEDDGMFIVFPTPEFYSVQSDNTLTRVSVGSTDADSGLVIETHDHQRVRPVLKENALTIMIGTGFSQWVTSSERLPAVMHGMRMPSSGTATERLLRAWFGKMTLLPSYHRMLKQMSFEGHTNATSRFLAQEVTRDTMTLGCAPGRQLEASALAECSFRDCTLKPGAGTPEESCGVICNRDHDGDAAACSKYCTCASGPNHGATCWMLCVKELDSCPVSDQACSGQSLICKASAPAPAPAPKPTSAPQPAPGPTSAPAPAPRPTSTLAPVPVPGPTPSQAQTSHLSPVPTFWLTSSPVVVPTDVPVAPTPIAMQPMAC